MVHAELRNLAPTEPRRRAPDEHFALITKDPQFLQSRCPDCWRNVLGSLMTRCPCAGVSVPAPPGDSVVEVTQRPGAAVGPLGRVAITCEPVEITPASGIIERL